MAEETRLRCTACRKVKTWDDVHVVVEDLWRIYYCAHCHGFISRSVPPSNRAELNRRLMARSTPAVPSEDIDRLLRLEDLEGPPSGSS